MIREKAMELVAALRSGEYKQGRNYLQDADGLSCCLGVACLINGSTKTLAGHRFMFEDNQSAYLPLSVLGDFGFFSRAGGRRDNLRLQMGDRTYSDLAQANDDGVPFPVIADYIEANWEAL